MSLFVPLTPHKLALVKKKKNYFTTGYNNFNFNFFFFTCTIEKGTFIFFIVQYHYLQPYTEK